MSYRTNWEAEVKHDGLNKYRKITGTDRFVVEQKANAQKAIWDEMWEKKQAKEQAIRYLTDKKEQAELATQDAADALEFLNEILIRALDRRKRFSWDSLKNMSTFKKDKPVQTYPLKAAHERPETAPNKEAPEYKPNFSFLDNILSKRKQAKIDECNNRFLKDYQKWERDTLVIKERNRKKDDQYQESLIQHEEMHKKSLLCWELEKSEFENKIKINHSQIDRQKEAYSLRTEVGLNNLIDIVLSTSVYPDYFPKDYNSAYSPDTKIAIIEYLLPSPEHIPTLKEVKYIQSKDEFKETHLSDAHLSKLYIV